jgi:hypothetical protein
MVKENIIVVWCGLAWGWGCYIVVSEKIIEVTRLNHGVGYIT